MRTADDQNAETNISCDSDEKHQEDDCAYILQSRFTPALNQT